MQGKRHEKFFQKNYLGVGLRYRFGVSILAIAYIADWVEEAKKAKYPTQKIVKIPDGIEILSSRLLTTGEHVFVAATIVNKSDRHWEGVKVQADLYDKEGFLTTCEKSNDLESDETINIDIVCFKMHLNMMPEDAKYKVFVASAREKNDFAQ